MNNYNNCFQFRGDVDGVPSITIFILCVEMLATVIRQSEYQRDFQRKN